mgnify:CR=1 FL=1
MNNIKFAVATDNSAEPSYYCKDNKFYRSETNQDVTTTDLPYSAFWTYPALFDGHFINLTNNVYPDEQFDLIFAAIECNPEYLHVLKKLYPNAVIVGMYKEIWNNNESVRNYIIRNTEAYIQPYPTIDFYHLHGLEQPKNAYVITHPINHKLLQEKYGTKKDETIFNYNRKVAGRHSTNNDEILKQIDLEVVNHNGEKGLQPFIKSWSRCKYLLSTDKATMGGIQSVQCAVLNTIMVGGNNDNHKILFPELTGTDVNQLVAKIKQLESDSEYRNQVQSYAYETCMNTFSYNAVRLQILNLYKELTNGN